MEKLKDFLSAAKSRFKLYFIVAALVVLGLLTFIFSDRIPFLSGVRARITQRANFPDVAQPTIINGELVLPREVTLDKGGGLGQMAQNNRLAVNSALLIPVFDQQQKLIGLRIVGEMTNIGTRIVDGISPIVKFYDSNGISVGQKVGKNTASYSFFSLEPQARTIYDVTVDAPPVSDRLEIIMNATSATTSALFEPMKIASRSVEVKTAVNQNAQTQTETETVSSDSAEIATPAAETVTKFDYFTVTGSVINIATDPFSEISVYAWARATDGKILSFATQEFKNDLLNQGDKVDFRITLLPFRDGVDYDKVEIAAWGKRYKLGL